MNSGTEISKILMRAIEKVDQLKSVDPSLSLSVPVGGIILSYKVLDEDDVPLLYYHIIILLYYGTLPIG